MRRGTLGAEVQVVEEAAVVAALAGAGAVLVGLVAAFLGGRVAAAQLRAAGVRSDLVDAPKAGGALVMWLLLALMGAAGAAWGGWYDAAEALGRLGVLVGRLGLGLAILVLAERLAAGLSTEDRRAVTLGGGVLAACAAIGDVGAIVAIAAVAAVLWVLGAARGRALAADALADLAAGIRLRSAKDRQLLLGEAVLDLEHVGLFRTRYRAGGEHHTLRNEAVLAMRGDSET